MHGRAVSERLTEAPLSVQERDRQCRSDDGRGEQRPAAAQRGHQQCRRAGVDGGDQQADAVGSGEVGDLDQRRPLQLRVGRQRPRADTARAGKLADQPPAGQQDRIRRAPLHQPRNPGGIATEVDRVQTGDRQRGKPARNDSESEVARQHSRQKRRHPDADCRRPTHPGHGRPPWRERRAGDQQRHEGDPGRHRPRQRWKRRGIGDARQASERKRSRRPDAGSAALGAESHLIGETAARLCRQLKGTRNGLKPDHDCTSFGMPSR